MKYVYRVYLNLPIIKKKQKTMEEDLTYFINFYVYAEGVKEMIQVYMLF